MGTLYSTIVILHIAVGTVALVTYWVAALARKGGTLHRGAGKGFLLAMIGVILTALPLAGFQFFRGQWAGGMFLSYLVILVASACWSGWFAIRYKRQPERFYGATQLALGMACGVAGATVSIVGFTLGSMLLGFFGLVGVSVVFESVRAYRKTERPANWWLREHYGAMIGNGVATHIAFLGIGLRSLLPETGWSVLQYGAWFGPLLVAIVAGIMLDRRHARPPRRVDAARTTA